jgi:hypothetical protein
MPGMRMMHMELRKEKSKAWEKEMPACFVGVDTDI